MQEVRDRVRLVDASEIGAREIQATVPRTEIQDVLGSKDGEPELVIEVTQGGEEAHTLRLAWDPGELEELLRKAHGDNVTLAFNGSELEQALEDDVAAHGLREAAVVLAVAATTAAAGAAGVAQAAQSGGSSATAAAPTSAVVSEREWPVGAAAAPSAASSGVVSEREWPVGAAAAPSAGAASASQEVVSDSTSAASDAATAGAVAGGVALMIAAAGFAVRRHRKIEPRPV
jgi:hypothetical protein